MSLMGKKVNIYFTSSQAIFEATVTHIASDVGDCWFVTDKLGLEHAVQHFESIDECPAPKSAELAATVPAVAAANKQIMPVCPCYKVEYSVSEESAGEFGIGVCTCEGKPA